MRATLALRYRFGSGTALLQGDNLRPGRFLRLLIGLFSARGLARFTALALGRSFAAPVAGIGCAVAAAFTATPTVVAAFLTLPTLVAPPTAPGVVTAVLAFSCALSAAGALPFAALLALLSIASRTRFAIFVSRLSRPLPGFSIVGSLGPGCLTVALARGRSRLAGCWLVASGPEQRRDHPFQKPRAGRTGIGGRSRLLCGAARFRGGSRRSSTFFRLASRAAGHGPAWLNGLNRCLARCRRCVFLFLQRDRLLSGLGQFEAGFADFLGNLIFAYPLNLIVRCFQVHVRNDHQVRACPSLNFRDLFSFFVEEIGGDVQWNHRADHRAAVFQRLLFHDSENTQSQRADVAYAALPAAARADFRRQLVQRGAEALT